MSKSIASGGLTPFSPSVNIPNSNIDWAISNIFTKSQHPSFGNLTFTMSNHTDGRSIILQVTNLSISSDLVINFPSFVTNQDNIVEANSIKLFSMVCINGMVRMTSASVSNSATN